MKPANYYASAVQIPDYVEYAIVSLSRHERLNFVDALIRAIRDRGWTSSNQNFNIEINADQWLHDQSPLTFKDLHKWISMELI
jgi:hypothetical protein